MVKLVSERKRGQYLFRFYNSRPQCLRQNFKEFRLYGGQVKFEDPCNSYNYLRVPFSLQKGLNVKSILSELHGDQLFPEQKSKILIH